MREIAQGVGLSVVVVVMLWSSLAAAAQEFVFRFEVARKAKVSHVGLGDGHAVLIILSQTPRDLKTQLEEQSKTGIKTKIDTLPFGGAELTFWLNRRIASYKLENKKGRLELLIVVPSRLEQVRAHVHEPLPRQVPSAFVADRFRLPELYLRRRRYARAAQRLSLLKDEFALQAWATLRLVDVALLTRDDSRETCAAYQGVLDAFPTRTSGILARLRLYVLQCPNSGADDLELVRVLQQLRRLDGNVGRFLWREAVFALEFAETTEDLEFALKQLAVDHRDAGTRRARRVVISRLAREQSSSYAVARMVLGHAAELRQHPEGAWLRLRGLLALRTLDLPNKTVQFSRLPLRRKNEGALWRVRHGEARLLTLRLEALRASGQSRAYQKGLATYLTRYKTEPTLAALPRSDLRVADLEPAKKFAGLRVRLRALRAAVSAQVGGRRTSSSRSRP